MDEHPWYTAEWVGATIFIAGFAYTVWFLLSGWLHEREHRQKRAENG